MAPFPIPVESVLLKPAAYLIYLLIGFAFGYVLEISGFGSSPKLAAQFYFKEMTVLKVMFTAIVVAMVFIFAASGLGLLDYNLIWVNPTYLWPGIVGGLIMGVGFIVGVFAPGLPWSPWLRLKRTACSSCWESCSASSCSADRSGRSKPGGTPAIWDVSHCRNYLGSRRAWLCCWWF